MVLLGVNIDHVATIRNARGGKEPDPLVAAQIAEAHGADGITIHLREDRRHILDEDVFKLKASVRTRLNLEMAATDEMVGIACQVKPYMVTLVPEKREERTTEGGLDVVGHEVDIKKHIAQLKQAGILVSLFVEPKPPQLEASARVGADYVELHTGAYAEHFDLGPVEATYYLKELIGAANYCKELGLKVNAGHGLTYNNVEPVLQIPGLVELNIGHNIISRAVFTGLGEAIAQMKALLNPVQSL